MDRKWQLFIKYLLDCAARANEEMGNSIPKASELGGWNEYILNFLQWLKKYNGDVKLQKNMGTLNVLASDTMGNPLNAEILFFPMEEIDRNCRLLRFCSGKKGSISLQIPEGQWRVVINKGSGYTSFQSEILIKSGRMAPAIEAVLKQIFPEEETHWYPGDIHHHSIFSSPLYGGTDPVTETPEDVMISMTAKGLRFGALSDHHNIFNHPSWRQTVNEEFLPIVSKEISTSNGHVISLGVPHDVIYEIPQENERTDAYMKSEFIRIAEVISGFGGIPQINHPADYQRAISWNRAYNDILPIFETMEIWNGSGPMMKGAPNYKAMELWLEQLDKGIFIAATTGSDTHNIAGDGYCECMGLLLDMFRFIEERTDLLQNEMQAKCHRIKNFLEPVVSEMRDWAQNGQSSGCIRTYVYSPTGCVEEGILNGLRNGNSFLTNGPILIPSINGCIPGQHAEKGYSQLEVHLQMSASNPLKHLIIRGNNGWQKSISLTAKKLNTDSIYDYSMDFILQVPEKIEWIVFSCKSDASNMAIANPIFI